LTRQIEIVFNSFILQLFKDKPEILRFLLNHERKQQVLVHVCQQISIAENSNIRTRFDAAKHNFLIFECVKMFCNAALMHAEQGLLSHAERSRLIDKANRIVNLEEQFTEEQKEFEKSLKC